MKLCLIKLSAVLAINQVAILCRLNQTFVLEKDFVGSAINTLLEQQTTVKPSKIDFVNGNTENFKDILEEVLIGCSDKFLVQTQTYKNIFSAQRYRRMFVIFFVDDFESFVNFCKSLSHESFRFNGFYMIVLKNHLKDMMEEAFELLWKKFIFNVVVLVPSSTNISLFTFMPFSGAVCSETKPIIINEFDDRTMKWNSEVFFPKKFKNLQKCPIRVGTIDNPPGTLIKTLDNGTKTYYGFEVDFANEFASALNFSVDLKINPNMINNIFPNKTGTGLYKNILEGKVDMIFGIFSIQQLRIELMSETRPFYNDRIILVVPPATLIGPIEKLLLPLEFNTWVANLILISIAFFVMTVLRFLPRKYHNFIIGKFVKNDYMNLWKILLGSGQSKLPSRNFARFLLMTLVLYCFIINCLYSASLFNIMKNDVTSRNIKSIDELDDLKYTFYIYETLAARLKDEKFMKR